MFFLNEKMKTDNELILLTSIVCFIQPWHAVMCCSVPYGSIVVHRWAMLVHCPTCSLFKMKGVWFILSQSHINTPSCCRRLSSEHQIWISPLLKIVLKSNAALKTTMPSCFSEITLPFISSVFVLSNFKRNKWADLCLLMDFIATRKKKSMPSEILDIVWSWCYCVCQVREKPRGDGAGRCDGDPPRAGLSDQLHCTAEVFDNTAVCRRRKQPRSANHIQTPITS